MYTCLLLFFEYAYLFIILQMYVYNVSKNIMYTCLLSLKCVYNVSKDIIK